MNINTETGQDSQAAAFDTLARTLQRQLPRRRVAGLVAAALATGVFGINSHSQSVEARRKRGHHQHGKRYANSVSAQAGKGTSSIPPNCIYVCCDGTCDSWKMCMKCVTWPKGNTIATVTSN